MVDMVDMVGIDHQSVESLNVKLSVETLVQNEFVRKSRWSTINSVFGWGLPIYIAMTLFNSPLVWWIFKEVLEGTKYKKYFDRYIDFFVTPKFGDDPTSADYDAYMPNSAKPFIFLGLVMEFFICLAMTIVWFISFGLKANSS